MQVVAQYQCEGGRLEGHTTLQRVVCGVREHAGVRGRVGEEQHTPRRFFSRSDSVSYFASWAFDMVARWVPARKAVGDESR